MKTSKELFERLQSDEAFLEEFEKKVVLEMKAQNGDYKKVWIPLAAEYGYELSGEELDARYNAVKEDVSEEELGKVAGGVTPTVLLLTTICISSPLSATMVSKSVQNGCF